MKTYEAVIMVVVCALATFLTRSLPFAIFPANKKTPHYMLYLGKVLPYAITAMLVVYCLSNISLQIYPHALPEIIGVAVVAISYLATKNTLAPIILGTITYMLLVQTVFI